MKNVFSIESLFQTVKHSDKFPIDEMKVKFRAEDAFEEKDVSSKFLEYSDYHDFEQRSKVTFLYCILFQGTKSV